MDVLIGLVLCAMLSVAVFVFFYFVGVFLGWGYDILKEKITGIKEEE